MCTLLKMVKARQGNTIYRSKYFQYFIQQKDLRKIGTRRCNWASWSDMKTIWLTYVKPLMWPEAVKHRDWIPYLVLNLAWTHLMTLHSKKLTFLPFIEIYFVIYHAHVMSLSRAPWSHKNMFYLERSNMRVTCTSPCELHELGTRGSKGWESGLWHSHMESHLNLSDQVFFRCGFIWT